jgi:hypothetical protein
MANTLALTVFLGFQGGGAPPLKCTLMWTHKRQNTLALTARRKLATATLRTSTPLGSVSHTVARQRLARQRMASANRIHTTNLPVELELGLALQLAQRRQGSADCLTWQPHGTLPHLSKLRRATRAVAIVYRV